MKRRGEAPQGAPARVMGRQSLPMKGLAQPQGGHGCGVPPSALRRFTLLELFEADRTERRPGAELFPERSGLPAGLFDK